MPMVKNGTEEIEAGLVDEGGMIDEESGNGVPNGALKEEVRDDQPAMLSPGEFVMPAYAVRYFGVENLVKMLRAAKQGMEQLDDLGLTGEPNSDDAGLETAVLPSEMQEKGATPTLAVGGMPTIKPGAVTTTALTNQPTQQTQFGVAPPVAIQPAAQPAAVQPLNFAAPSPLTQQMYRPTAPIRIPGQQNVTYPEYIYSPTPGGTGYGVAEYVGPNGQSIFVTTINGKPIGQIPEGYVTRAEYTEKQKEGKTTTPPTELQRKPEDMDPGSFTEPIPGQEGDQDLTAEQMQTLADFGWGKGTTAGQATVGSMVGAVTTGVPGLLAPIIGFFGDKAARAFARSTVSKQISRQSQLSSKPPPLNKKYTKEEVEQWIRGSMSKDEIAAVQEAQIAADAAAAAAGSRAIDAAQARADAVEADPMSTQFDIDAANEAVIDAAEEAAGQQGIDIGSIDTGSGSDAPSFDPSVAPGGIGDADVAAGGGEDGTYGFKKGGLISMANGGMITVGDKTYSPEDFGFASKGALVKKRKTPAKKKRGKGLASSK
jgi:hypothetical protein